VFLCDVDFSSTTGDTFRFILMIVLNFTIFVVV
jgi:hypothetical protein